VICLTDPLIPTLENERIKQGDRLVLILTYDHFGRTSNSVIFRIASELSGTGVGSTSSSYIYVLAMASMAPSGENEMLTMEVGNLWEK
jgi:hypothetical protein